MQYSLYISLLFVALCSCLYSVFYAAWLPFHYACVMQWFVDFWVISNLILCFYCTFLTVIILVICFECSHLILCMQTQCVLCKFGYRICLSTIVRVTTHLENLEKSGNSKVVREKSGKMEKVRGKSGEVKSGVFFQALNTPKLVFRPGLCPGPRLRRSPRLPSRLGRGTPHPLPPAITTPTVKLLVAWHSG